MAHLSAFPNQLRACGLEGVSQGLVLPLVSMRPHQHCLSGELSAVRLIVQQHYLHPVYVFKILGNIHGALQWFTQYNVKAELISCF